MPNKIKINYKETPTNIQGRDLFRTPYYATDLLVPYIPTDIELIWECASGENHIAKRLEHFGYRVFSSDIDGNSSYINFLLDKPPEFGQRYCIVTNPPYSLKRKFFLRCIELDVPFALLIPADYCMWTIDAVRKYDCEKIIPTRRIDFITPTKRKGTTSNYHSLWLTRYFGLLETETFVELTTEDKKNIGE